MGTHDVYKIPNQIGHTAYGVVFMTDDAPSWKYLAGVEVSNLTGLPTGLSHVSFPPQKYALFSHKGHVWTLRNTIGEIGKKGLPNSGRQPAGPSAGAPNFFERYGEKFNPQTGTGDIEVWVPIL